MARNDLKVNPQRYVTISERFWQVTASPAIEPVYIARTSTLKDLTPVLKTDGFVIQWENKYLLSQNTMDLILQRDSPHYSIEANGDILGVEIGRSLPVIKIDLTPIYELAEYRQELDIKAAIKFAEWLFLGDKTPVGDVPLRLINWIDYMLGGTTQSPTETFEIYVFPLELTSLQKEINQFATEITWNQSATSIIIAQDKTTNYITKVIGYLQALKRDFDSIQKVFSLGYTPPDGVVDFIRTTNKVVNDKEEFVVKPIDMVVSTLTGIAPRTEQRVQEQLDKVTNTQQGVQQQIDDLINVTTQLNVTQQNTRG